MILRNTFIILLTVFSAKLSAQQLIHIPDTNLRNALKAARLTTKDSLDRYKISGYLQLELNNKGIKNLDGLQYFERLWRLEINNNEIESLIYLPPNLTSLSCNNNKLTTIDSLPKKLENLNCSDNKLTIIDDLPNELKVLNCHNNKISSLENLPELLESINFSNNTLTYFPKLPYHKLEIVNYYNNPIPFDSLPILYQTLGCDDSHQNCLPNKLRNWEILNHNIKKSEIENINRIGIQFLSSYIGYIESSGFKSEEVNFVLNDENFIAEKIIINETINYYDKDTSESKKVEPINITIKNSEIQELLNDIYSENLKFNIPFNDSIIQIDFENRKLKNKNFYLMSPRSSHGTDNNLIFSFYSPTDTIKINYYFSSSSFISLSKQKLSSILDWLYMYKLVNLFFQNHQQLNEKYFNQYNLDEAMNLPN
jgi:hypothetical protein